MRIGLLNAVPHISVRLSLGQAKFLLQHALFAPAYRCRLSIHGPASGR
jgi:hypothetical protein